MLHTILSVPTELPPFYEQIMRKLKVLNLQLSDKETISKAYYKEGKFTILENECVHLLEFWFKVDKYYQNNTGWLDLIMEKYGFIENRVIIDYLEALHQTKVIGVQHLQKLTGITHMDKYDELEWIPAATEEDAKQNAIQELESILIGSRFGKYFYAVWEATEKGAKYNDLLKIKPVEFGLPDTWEEFLGSATDQYTTILNAIGVHFRLEDGGNPAGFMNTLLTGIGVKYQFNEDGESNNLSRINDIAKEIDAPYFVIMDAYDIMNFRHLRPSPKSNS